jgi:hypothetical protein
MYAIVRDGRVENTCLWDGITPWEPPAGTTAIPCPDNVAIGYTYDGAEWTPPSAPPPEVRKVGKIDFIRLFTPAEEEAFDLASLRANALTPDNFGAPENAGLRALRSFLRRYDPLDVIELTHPETIAGMGLLVALGILTQARADEILAHQP